MFEALQYHLFQVSRCFICSCFVFMARTCTLPCCSPVLCLLVRGKYFISLLPPIFALQISIPCLKPLKSSALEHLVLLIFWRVNAALEQFFRSPQRDLLRIKYDPAISEILFSPSVEVTNRFVVFDRYFRNCLIRIEFKFQQTDGQRTQAVPKTECGEQICRSFD